MQLYTNFFIEVLRAYPPSKILLTENNKSVSASDLLHTATSLAISLSKHNVKKGDRVIIAAQPGIQFLQIMYANMMLGTVTSIIDPEMGRDNYLAKLKQFAPHHAFADSRLVFLNEHPLLKMLLLKLNNSIPSFPRIKNCSLFTSGMYLPIFQKHVRISSLLKTPSSVTDLQLMKEEEEFLVTYTSGTLSEPKGVVHTYAGLSHSIQLLTDLLQKNRDEIIATHLPHFALLGINAGVKVFLWDSKMNAAQKIDFIAANNITTLFGPPSDFTPLITHLLKHGHKMPVCLKNIYLGSAPVYTSFLSRLIPLSDTLKVTVLYGMTENLMVASQDGHQKLQETVEGDLVGIPFSNVRITIETDGEISLSSDQLFARYWNGEKINGKHFTGDIGRLDDTGRLILLGRKKDMIIRRNFNVYPGLYEPTISKIKGVNEVAMIGIYNNNKSDEEIILVIDGEKSLNESAIMNHLKQGKYSIDKEALPDRIIFMKIPHSGRQQKVNKKELVSLLKSAYQ